MLDKKQILIIGFLAALIGLVSAALVKAIQDRRRPPPPRSITAPAEIPPPPPQPVIPPPPGPFRPPAPPPLPIEVPLTNITEPLSQAAPVSTEIISAKKELPKSTKGRAIYLRISSTPRCMIGDLDIIRDELKHSPTKRLLLTVEPLFYGKQFPPQIAVVTESQLERGVMQSFLLPESPTPSLFAVFLCKDDDENGRCASKPARPLDAVYRKYHPTAGGSGVADSDRAGDKLYYFHAGLLESGWVNFINTELEPQQYQELVKMLVPYAEAPEDALMMVRKIRKLNSTLRSAQALVTGSFIGIDLPHLEPGSCQKVGPKPLFSIPEKSTAPDLGDLRRNRN